MLLVIFFTQYLHQKAEPMIPLPPMVSVPPVTRAPWGFMGNAARLLFMNREEWRSQSHGLIRWTRTIDSRRPCVHTSHKHATCQGQTPAQESGSDEGVCVCEGGRK